MAYLMRKQLMFASFPDLYPLKEVEKKIYLFQENVKLHVEALPLRRIQLFI